MTTESKQAPTTGGGTPVLFRSTGVLLSSAAAALAVVLALAVVAGLTTGSTGAAGALTGGVVALLVFLTGSVVVDTVAGIAPQLSLLFALSTYTLQLLVLGLFFSALQRSDLMGRVLHPTWLGGAIIATTCGWLVVQVVLTTQARIPVYDLRPEAGER